MRLACTASWILLLLSGCFSLLIEGGLLIHPVAPDLTRLPARIASLDLLEEIPVESAALGDLPPEHFAFRRIRDGAGNEGKLYVAYYRRAQRWSGRPHDVNVCYEALGWQERSARCSRASPFPWTRVFEREGEAIRVLHWTEHPGVEADPIAPATIASRLVAPRGFRPDVASIYLEFAEPAAPPAEELQAAAQALSAALETLWVQAELD